MNSVVSWSGGKDSMLALLRERAAGHRIDALLAMFDESGERSRSHGIAPALMHAQAQALGIPLVICRAGWADYEAVFVARLHEFARQGVARVVFGDIDLQAHRDWEEGACARAGMRAVLPLWHEPRRALVDEVLRLGIRARVVCVDARWLGARWCGREFDSAFLAELPPEVDSCGENGEFHTFVFDGPGFAHPVKHRLLAVHEVQSAAPVAARHFVAELVS